MSYQRANKKKDTLWNVILVLAVIALVIVLLALTPIFSFLSRGSHVAGVGLWRAGEATETGIVNGKKIITTSKTKLVRENETLRDQIDEYKGKSLINQKLQTENTELRALLNVVDESRNFVTARVISQPSKSAYNTLIINGGEKDAIGTGDKVTAYGTVLLGEVVEVFARTSKVRLYSSPGVVREAILTQGGSRLPIEGNGGGNFRIELPRDIEVTEGTQFIDAVTSLVLATVQAKIFDPREPFQTIVARSPIHVGNLEWVQVMKDN